MDKYKEDLAHIHAMMERSSRFISLSGISGVFAGLIALAAAAVAYYLFESSGISYFSGQRSIYPLPLVKALILTALFALAAALFCAIYFTVRKSRKKHIAIWTHLTRRLLINLFIPLLAGGLFCLALLLYGLFGFIAPTMLVFYGLALINAGKFTFDDIIYLGYCELALGIVAMFLIGYGLLFWAIGFGVLHIIYGLLMYKKYH